MANRRARTRPFAHNNRWTWIRFTWMLECCVLWRQSALPFVRCCNRQLLILHPTPNRSSNNTVPCIDDAVNNYEYQKFNVIARQRQTNTIGADKNRYSRDMELTFCYAIHCVCESRLRVFQSWCLDAKKLELWKKNPGRQSKCWFRTAKKRYISKWLRV